MPAARTPKHKARPRPDHPILELLALLPADAMPLVLMPCPSCQSTVGRWSGPWRQCRACGSSWLFSRALTRRLRASA